MNYRHKRMKAYKTRPDFWGALEALLYELKPIGYMFFAVAVLKTPWTEALWIKYSAVGIVLFGAYLIYSRLVNRGYL